MTPFFKKMEYKNCISPCSIGQQNLNALLNKKTSNIKEKMIKMIFPDGRCVDLPILQDKYKKILFADVRNIYEKHKILFYDPGFSSVAACPSAITYIDGNLGKCLYRGYDVIELVKKFSYLDVCYLLLNGEFGTRDQMNHFHKCIGEESLVHTKINEFIRTFIPGAHPMSILDSALAAMASFYDNPMDSDNMLKIEVRERACIRILAKFPTICAMAYKNLIGEPFVYPQTKFNYAENFLHMMFSKPTEPYVPNPLHVKIINTFLILHADHEMNASTTTVRAAGSSLANPYACIATGVTSLWGRAHGGANHAVLEMLREIKTVENIPNFIQKVKNKEFRLMGFGHRIYKNFDPRANIMQKLAEQLFDESQKKDEMFFIAKELEKYALNDEYFVSRKLYPNVDFYSGIVMRALNIPEEMFTVLFALGRSVGWLAHWKEMVEENQIKIVRPRQFYVGHEERKIPDYF